MAAIIPCDKCIHGKVCAMGFQFRRETANVTIVCKDIVRKTDVAPRAEVAREIFEEIKDLMREWFDFFRQDDGIRESCAILAALSQISELEKKYTEGQK